MSSLAAIDLDNVISKTDPKIRQIIQSISGIALSQQDIQSWDYAEVLVAKGLDPSRAKEIMGETFNQFHSKDCSEVELIDGALESISEFQKLGFEIVIVTGRERSPACEDLTKTWLETFSIPASWLTFVGNKAEFCTNWALLIDDAPHHAREVANRGIRVLLFNYPWNSNVAHDPLITRVNGWNEIVVTLKQLCCSK